MKKYLCLLAILLTACVPAAGTTEPNPPPIGTEARLDTVTAPMVDVPTQPVSSASATLPPGPLTLVALGDSLTQGDGDDAGLGGYPGRLLALVNAVRPGSTLVNLGQSGWNSDALIHGDQGLEGQLDRAVVELQNAVAQGRGAVALVWIGSNDLWYLYEYGGDINDEADAQDLAHFTANMDLILSRLRSTGAVVLVALLDDQSRRPVALKGEAFTAITPDELARMSAQAVRYNESLAQLVARHGAVTVDFYNTDIFTNPATLYDDGNHPNSAGYDAITQKWWQELQGYL